MPTSTERGRRCAPATPPRRVPWFDAKRQPRCVDCVKILVAERRNPRHRPSRRLVLRSSLGVRSARGETPLSLACPELVEGVAARPAQSLSDEAGSDCPFLQPFLQPAPLHSPRSPPEVKAASGHRTPKAPPIRKLSSDLFGVASGEAESPGERGSIVPLAYVAAPSFRPRHASPEPPRQPRHPPTPISAPSPLLSATFGRVAPGAMVLRRPEGPNDLSRARKGPVNAPPHAPRPAGPAERFQTGRSVQIISVAPSGLSAYADITTGPFRARLSSVGPPGLHDSAWRQLRAGA